MKTKQKPRTQRTHTCVARSLGLLAGPMTFVGSAAAQDAKLVDPNAAKDGESPHDAALKAAARGDYIAAVALAKQAAADGHPLDADQVDFMTTKSNAQQAALDENAKSKAAQAAAAATAQEIADRQQKQYAEREKAKVSNGRCGADNQRTQTLQNQVANRAASSTAAQSGVAGPLTSEGGAKC